MLTQEELENEKQYLDKVLKVIKDELTEFNGQVKSFSDDIKEQMSYAWDKTNRLSDTEFVYALANIQKRSVYAENANKKVKAYEKMLDNTYFARIDFEDDELGDHLTIYIGISSVTKDRERLVFDWRAPISSMFYNSEVGRASYQISTGEKISGNITLKRQYKISDGKLKEVFDTDMQIIDDILKKILSSNASNKMKNIVTTIQKEQNEIIRKNDSDLFVVQGPAGSGKTSIAMHKIAYLLYSERDKIDNSNVMILSPNNIFNNYISDVLPGIGEENVAEATFFEFAKNYITEFKISTKIEDIYEIVYASKDKKNMDKFNEIRFKYDPIYVKIIDELIRDNKIELLNFDEISINESIIIDNFDIKKIVNSMKNYGESLYLEGKKIIDRIYNIASTRTQKQLTISKLKSLALENLTKIRSKISALYKKLYGNKNYFIRLVSRVFRENGRQVSEYDLEKIYDISSKAILDDRLEFQDVAPFMYLKSKIIGISPNKRIQYVLIDEAQDYTLLQYSILAMLFKNSNLTLLGDLNQSILPFNTYDNYNGIIDVIKKYKTSASPSEYSLKKTYRSTFEINNFAKKVINSNNSYSQIDRHGDEVIITKQEEFNPKQILSRAVELKNSYNTVAIICKNIDEVSSYKDAIENFDDPNRFRIVTKNDSIFVEEKIMIIPSYLSKGLEFDAVLISNANDNFYQENERNLFYVVLTRALHKLEIFYTEKFTALIIR